MTNHELTERYIYAVTRRLPTDSGDDVAKELGGLIADMLEERTGGNEATQEQLRMVLTELGSPYELAAGYHPQQGGLIPPPYYAYYLTVLRIVLAAACGGMVVAQLLAAAIDPDFATTQLGINLPDNVYGIIATLLAGVFSAAVQAFTWVTITFAVMARRAVKLDEDKSFLDSLPELPDNRKRIGKGGAIAGIVFSVVAAMVLPCAPQVICVIQDGVVTSVFDPEVMRSLWWVFIGIGVVGVVSGCAELLEGYRTRRLMVINIICNVVFAVLAVVWLGNPHILMAGYHQIFASMLDGAALLFMSNLNLVALGGILLGIAIDTGESIYTTLRR